MLAYFTLPLKLNMEFKLVWSLSDIKLHLIANLLPDLTAHKCYFGIYNVKWKWKAWRLNEYKLCDAWLLLKSGKLSSQFKMISFNRAWFLKHKVTIQVLSKIRRQWEAKELLFIEPNAPVCVQGFILNPWKLPSLVTEDKQYTLLFWRASPFLTWERVAPSIIATSKNFILLTWRLIALWVQSQQVIPAISGNARVASSKLGNIWRLGGWSL